MKTVVCDKCNGPQDAFDMKAAAPHGPFPEWHLKGQYMFNVSGDYCLCCALLPFKQQILEILGVEEKESVNEHHAGAPDGVRHVAVTRPWLRPYVLFRQWRANKRNLPHE